MERERPEYLPPIERKRWNFPWLITGFLTLVSLTAIGVLTLGRTNSAWSERFEGIPRSIEAAEQSSTVRTEPPTAVSSVPSALPERQQVQPSQKAQNLRCINGMLFRRIEGGWENLPNSNCDAKTPNNVQCFSGRAYMRMDDGAWAYTNSVRCP
jgi:hypothetical protein